MAGIRGGAPGILGTQTFMYMKMLKFFITPLSTLRCGCSIRQEELVHLGKL